MKKNNITEKMIVAVDPYNKVKNSPEVFSTVTGIVFKVGSKTCDVISLQTMEILTINKDYIYDISEIGSPYGDFQITRDSVPIFTIDEVHVLRILKKSGCLNGKEAELLDNIIDKVESNILSETIVKGIVESKDCSIDYPTVNTIVNYNIKDNPEDNLKDSINMINHLEQVSLFIDKTLYMNNLNKIRSNLSNLIVRMFESEGVTVETAKTIIDMIVDAIRGITPDLFDSPIFVENVMEVYTKFEEVNDRKAIAEHIFTTKVGIIPRHIIQRITTLFIMSETGDIMNDHMGDFNMPFNPDMFGEDYEE